MRHPLKSVHFKGFTPGLNEERIDLGGRNHATRFQILWNDETRFVEVIDSKKPGEVYEIPGEAVACIVRAPRVSRKKDGE